MCYLKYHIVGFHYFLCFSYLQDTHVKIIYLFLLLQKGDSVVGSKGCLFGRAKEIEKRKSSLTERYG